MAAVIIDGRELAKEIELALAGEIKKFSVKPLLAVVLAGDDPASKIYVGMKTKRANACGIDTADFHYPNEITTEELKSEIKKIASGANGRVPSGILVQLPLPKHINTDEVMTALPPGMDVDGLLPQSQGLMFQGQDTFLPCTPHGILKLIDKANLLLGNDIASIAGKKAVVLGRSLIVGRPLGIMLLKRNCTVTYCHSFTKNLQEECRQADILVAAIGKPRMVTAEYVKPSAIVIDVGITRVGDKIVGDVDYDSVSQIAGAITPVPGGVGPMTIAMLLSNVVKAAAC